MRHILLSVFLFLLPAADIISAVPARTGSMLSRQSKLTTESDQLPSCFKSFGLKFDHFFEPQFAFDGRIGLALLYDGSFTSVKIFSYCVERASAAAHIDLTQDFAVTDRRGLPTPIDLMVHDKTGLIAVYGLGPEGGKKVLLLSSDAEGRLQRFWSTTFAAAPESDAEHLAFNRDGSAIFFIYGNHFAQGLEPGERTIHKRMLSKSMAVTDSTDEQLTIPPPEPGQVASESDFWRLALLRTEDGSLVAETGLPSSSSASVLYNEGRDQAVVLMDHMVHIFAPEKVGLQVETLFTVDEALRLHGQGFSADGRYLIAYGGYVPIASKRGKNFYYAFDLVRKTSRELALEQSLFPVWNATTFHQPTRALYVPLSSRMVIKDECQRINFMLGGNRTIEVITLNADGSLSGSLTFEIPEAAPGSPGLHGLGPEPFRIAITATGALGLISLGSLSAPAGRVLAFDTLTGDITDEIIVDRPFATMHLFENLGVFVSADATANLPVIKVETGPVIEEVIVKKNRTIIKGSNFLSGARIRINSEEIGAGDRSPDNPGREISIRRGKRDFPRGQQLTLVVINRDGAESEPFTFSR